MRSSELAAAAGVTVRTLRHYHQIGVLAEPPRGSNGYRRYTVRDLITVLRIRRLAALGMPLDQMTGVLDSTSQDHTGLLDALEQELDAEIGRLNRQKAMLKVARDCETAPDVPSELARFIRAFALAGHSEAINRFDREQAVLLAHLFSAIGLDQLIEVYERISAPDLAVVRRDLTERFDRLGPDTGDGVIDAFVEDFVCHLAADIDAIVVGVGWQHAGAYPFDHQTAGLMHQYLHEVLNPAQEAAITAILSRLWPESAPDLVPGNLCGDVLAPSNHQIPS